MSLQVTPKEETQGQQEKALKTDAEIEVMQPQAKGHLKPPETRRGKDASFLEASEGV